MSRRSTARRLLVAAAAVGLIWEGSADARAGRNCELLEDERGDSGILGGEGLGGPLPGTYESALDIVSADLAADSSRLTVVIRVADLTTPEEPLPQGASGSFHFASPGAGVLHRRGTDFQR